MNIVDALIIIVIIIYIMGGIKDGLIKSSISLIGLILITVLAYYLKNPISTIMYTNLPFITFKFLPSAYNILLYELIAFFICFSILSIILRIVLKITNIVEKILKSTIILGFFSKLGGLVVGFIKGYVIVFITLFILTNPLFNISGINESKFTNIILDKTPILSSAISNKRNVINEIISIKDAYKDNDKVIELFLKYEIISNDNLEILIKKGKI